MFYPFLPVLPLAQLTISDNPPPTEPPPRMSFTDLQQGLRDVRDGKVDTSTYRNGIIILLAVLALIVLVIHLRQRRKIAAPPDNLRKLSRELGRKVPFPLGAKFLLHCVARTTKTPFPALLLSSALFDKCVAQWAREPSFAAMRGWGRSRLLHLRPILFN